MPELSTSDRLALLEDAVGVRPPTLEDESRAITPEEQLDEYRSQKKLILVEMSAKLDTRQRVLLQRRLDTAEARIRGVCTGDAPELRLDALRSERDTFLRYAKMVDNPNPARGSIPAAELRERARVRVPQVQEQIELATAELARVMESVE